MGKARMKSFQWRAQLSCRRGKKEPMCDWNVLRREERDIALLYILGVQSGKCSWRIYFKNRYLTRESLLPTFDCQSQSWYELKELRLITGTYTDAAGNSGSDSTLPSFYREKPQNLSRYDDKLCFPYAWWINKNRWTRTRKEGHNDYAIKYFRGQLDKNRHVQLNTQLLGENTSFFSRAVIQKCAWIWNRFCCLYLFRRMMTLMLAEVERLRTFWFRFSPSSLFRQRDYKLPPPCTGEGFYKELSGIEAVHERSFRYAKEVLKR